MYTILLQLGKLVQTSTSNHCFELQFKQQILQFFWINLAMLSKSEYALRNNCAVIIKFHQAFNLDVEIGLH